MAAYEFCAKYSAWWVGFCMEIDLWILYGSHFYAENEKAAKGVKY
jgi:hypothetical protein